MKILNLASRNRVTLQDKYTNSAKIGLPIYKVAQWVAHMICNREVVGSNPIFEDIGLTAMTDNHLQF